MSDAWRRGLPTVVDGAAIPYGYTLVVAASGGVLIHTHGPPGSGAAYRFLGRGGGRPRPGPRRGPGPIGAPMSDAPDPRLAVVGGVAAAVALGLADLVAEAVDGHAAFPLATFVATVAYLGLAGAGAAFFTLSPTPHPRRADVHPD